MTELDQSTELEGGGVSPNEPAVSDSEEEGRFPRLLSDLHRLAKSILRGQSPDNMLQTTALVHEAFLRMRHLDPAQFPDDRHFIAYAARTMRSILVDAARSRARKIEQRVGERVPVEDLAERYEAELGSLIDLDEALDSLEEQDPRLFEVAVLRLFTGLTMQEIADQLGRPLRTTELHWELARRWLSRALR